MSKKAQQKKQSKKKKIKPVKTVEDLELLTVSINTVMQSKIYHSVTPKIVGKYSNMELDTGSAICYSNLDLQRAVSPQTVISDKY